MEKKIIWKTQKEKKYALSPLSLILFGFLCSFRRGFIILWMLLCCFKGDYWREFV